MAGTAQEPGRLPDLSVPGRLRTVLRDGAAAVARAAPLVGGARRFSGPQVRRDRRTFGRMAADQRVGREVVRREDHEGVGGSRPSARGSHYRGADTVENPGLRTLPGGGCDHRCRARSGGAHRGAYRILRCRREARRFPYSGPRRGAGRTALARGSSAGAPTLRPGRRLSIRRSADS